MYGQTKGQKMIDYMILIFLSVSFAQLLIKYNANGLTTRPYNIKPKHKDCRRPNHPNCRVSEISRREMDYTQAVTTSIQYGKVCSAKMGYNRDK